MHGTSETPPATPVVLTPGEPAGIGAEIALKAWQCPAMPVFFLIDDPERVRQCGRSAGLDVPVVAIAGPGEATSAFQHGLPVLGRRFPVPVTPGQPDPANAGTVIDAIREAVELVCAGSAAAVVTNPIQKHSLHCAGFPYPGHTEFLAALAGAARAVMMLASPTLRVVPVTIHEPIRKVPDLLDRDLIVETARITAQALARDFAIPAPRLAIAGLNPHAGEAGSIGSEDAEIIAPAVAALCADGLAVTGPLAADSMFHAAARAQYDAALCMYHDQALIPIKTLDFWGGVNVTLGLPFVRTSPDHGTGLDRAGSGSARADSLVAAIHMAAAMAARRRACDAKP